MNKKLQTLKGFRDYLPQEALKRQWLIDKIRSVFEKWGYDPIETPTLEPLELFEGQIGEDEKLFFKFQDAGGRNVALRYDQTVPTSRVVSQYYSQLPMPFRRYQIQNAFRAEKPQKGRDREFLQCDADIFGINSPLADAEVIALSMDIYKQIGFKKIKTFINDRSLLKDMPYTAIVSIDKIKKIGKEGVIKEISAKGVEEKKAREYLKYIESLKPSDNINFIFDYLDKLGFPKDWYEFSPTLARAFSYSTGPIWEIEIPDYNSGSVLGGERFDSLVKRISGLDVPGTGFGLGFPRTLEAALQFGLVFDIKTNSKVLVTIFSPKFLVQSIEAVKLLRQGNINTELYPDENASLDKQLKYADKKGIPFAIIIGPDEVKDKKVVLKNLLTREQVKIQLDKLVSFL